MRGANGRDTRRNMLRGSTNIHRVSTLKDTRLQGSTSLSVERLVETPCGLAYPTFQARHSPMRFRQCADLRSGAQRIRTRPTSLNYPGQAKPYPFTELLCRFTSCSARSFAKSDDAHPSIHPCEALETHDVPISPRSSVNESDSVSLYIY